MALRKIARIVRAAQTDADIARRTAHTPQFRKAVAKDRRSALSEYTTVKHALRDRERLQAAKEKPKARPTREKQGAEPPTRKRKS